MSEEITADEFRTAAKVLRTKKAHEDLGEYAAEAKWCDRQAARLDNLPVFEDGYIDQVAARVCVADRLLDNLPGDFVVKRIIDLVHLAVAELAADGHLVPAGGKVLTAEDVAENEAIAAEAGRMDQKIIAAQVYANRIRASQIWTRNNAEAFADLMALFPEPASEPELWATWEDVPTGVLYRSAAMSAREPLMGLGLTFMNHADGKRWVHRRDGRHHLSDSNEARMKRLAPFVRAEAGDQA